MPCESANGDYATRCKWLSYREQDVLGRPLTVDDVAYVSEMARRIAAILLLGPDLDAAYEQARATVLSTGRSPQ